MHSSGASRVDLNSKTTVHQSALPLERLSCCYLLAVATVTASLKVLLQPCV